MIESMFGVLLYLSVALLIGVIVGWYLSGVMKHKEGLIELDVLQKHYEEKEEVIKKLKEEYSLQKQNIDRLTDEGIVCRHQLLQKSNFLTKKSDELFRAQSKLMEVKLIEKERNGLERKVSELNVLLKEKEKELKVLETVFLEADTAVNKEIMYQFSQERKKIKEKQMIIRTLELEIQKLQRQVENKEQLIHSLTQELTLFKENEEDFEAMKADHMLISKDQFNEIEKRLLEYTERMKHLEEENIKLSQSSILQPRDRRVNIFSELHFYWYEKKKWLKSKLVDQSVANITKA